MSFGSRAAPSGRDRRCASRRGVGASGAVSDDEEDADDGPQPSLLPPTPEPRVPTVATLPHHTGELASSRLMRMKRRARAASRSVSSAADWRSLLTHVQGRASSTHLQRLDLTATVMNNEEWCWFCWDVLPTLRSLTFLKLAHTGLTDKRLAELLRGCRVDYARPGATLLSSSSSRRSAPCVSSRCGVSEGASTSDSFAAKVGAHAEAVMTGTRERRTLRRLSVLDLGGNHLTHRSAAPLGKLLLWAADTLDELHLMGNSLQDYGFQILAIYLAKLQLSSLHKERHLFPPLLVQQYLDLVEKRKQSNREARLQHTMRRGSSLAVVDGGRNDESGLRDVCGDCGDMQIHLGISFLDLRDCQGSARGISEVLVGASHAHRLEILLLARNRVIPPTLNSLNSTHAGELTSCATGGISDDTHGGERMSSIVCKFSSFKELRHPCALTVVNLCGVPLSKLCTPIGCRELFLNVFFCCPRLLLLDVSESFDCRQISPSLLLQTLTEGQRRSSHSSVCWRTEWGVEETAEFTLDFVSLGLQACVGGILCELFAHAAFHAQQRQTMAPSAFCHLQELHLNGTGITDRASQGLAIAVQSSASTGVLSSLTVLNMSDNLLTICGCVQIVRAFILDWPSRPSVLSALALQGNAGIHCDDKDAIVRLRQVADAAVRRRCKERRRYDPGSWTVPLLPLSIHLGAAGGATFTITSDEEPAFTAPRAQSADPARRSAARDDKAGTLVEGETESGHAEEHENRGGEHGADACFSVSSPMEDGTVPLAERPMEMSFRSPRSAWGATRCDVSSIPAGGSPRKFSFSGPATPSLLRRLVGGTPSHFCTPQQHEQQEDEKRVKGRQRQRGSVPLLSPVLANDLSPVCNGYNGGFIGDEEAKVGSRVAARSPIEFSASHSTDSMPFVPLTRWGVEEGQWARDVATVRARGRGADRYTAPPPLPPPSQKQHKQDVLQDELSPLHRNLFSSSPPSLKAFDFGRLFVSTGAKSVGELNMGRERDLPLDCVNLRGGGGSSGARDETHMLYEEAETLVHFGENGATTGDFLCDALQMTSAYEGAKAPKKRFVVASEVTGDVIAKRHGEEVVAQPQLREESLTGHLDEEEQPMRATMRSKTRTATMTQLRPHEVYTNGVAPFCSAAATAGEKGERVKQDEAHQLSFQRSEANDTDSSDMKEELVPDHKDEQAMLHDGRSTRRLKTLVLSYHHPEGHVLCRGWRLLHRDDSVGADARACVERDIWTFLQPPDVRQGQVVNTVSLIMPLCRDMEMDAEHGVTRVQIVSNEHRSVLAERMQRGANIDDGRVAFPLFTEALRQSAEDTVEIVGAMLDAAHDALPAIYRNISAGELVHALHGGEDELMAEIGAIVAAVNERSAPEMTVKKEECALGSLLLTADVGAEDDDDLSPSRGEAETFFRDPHLPHPDKQRRHKEEEEEREDSETRVSGEKTPTRDVDSTRCASTTSGVQQLPPATTRLPSQPEANVSPESTTPTSTAITTSPRALAIMSSGAVGKVSEVVTCPEQRLASGRMKTFEFSLPHHKGHCFCRGWLLLHRTDPVGEEARRRLEADVLSFLRTPSSERSAPSKDNGFVDAGGVGVDAAAVSTVELVSFLWERSSSTMWLRVVTSERRAVISERLQHITADGEKTLPRFTEFLDSNIAYDTIRLVEAYLQWQPLEELRQRVASRFSSVSTLVHYYHGDEAALLLEIGATCMAHIEAAVFSAPAGAAVAFNVADGALPESKGIRDVKNYENDDVSDDDGRSTTETLGNAQAGLPLEHVDNAQGGDTPTQRRSTVSDDRRVVVEERQGEVREGSLQPRRSSSRLAASFFSPDTAGVRCALLTPPRDGSSREQSYGGNRDDDSNERDNDKRAVALIGRAFADKLCRLQFLAYNAMVQGALLLDKKHRHKIRICKGKWGQQSVTIAVEWDVFLVVYFVKGTTFGLTSRKLLVVVHPVAHGVQCFLDDVHNTGGHSHNLRIQLERDYSPQELGVSLPDMERRLQQVATPGKSRRGTLSSHEGRAPQQSPSSNNNNSSIVSNSLSDVPMDPAVSAPSAAQLMQRVVSIEVTLSSLSKAQEAVAAIRSAGQRAVSMIQQTIAGQEH